MSQLHLSIIEGSPYYEEKRVGRVANQSAQDEDVKSVPERIGKLLFMLKICCPRYTTH